jgi:RNA polymerase sigma-70 factor (ECF subfamily)
VTRGLHLLLPDGPEVGGLVALILTDARRAARTTLGAMPCCCLTKTGRVGPDEDRRSPCSTPRRPVAARPFQLQAASVASRGDADSHERTDWHRILALYDQLLRSAPSPVVHANHAVGVSTTNGPAVGLAILEALALRPDLARWPHLYTARAGLLGEPGRVEDGVPAYRSALALAPPARRAAVHPSPNLPTHPYAPAPVNPATQLR